jgi:hypothetical protein
MGVYKVDLQQVIDSIPQTLTISAKTEDDAINAALVMAEAIVWNLEEKLFRILSVTDSRKV